MIFKPWLRVASLSILLAASAASAQTVREQMHDAGVHVYAVLFAFSVDQTSTLRTFRALRVMESAKGLVNTVNIPVPAAYVDAARKKMLARHSPPTLKDGKPTEMYTYFLFEPHHPDVVITNLDLPMDQQP